MTAQTLRDIALVHAGRNPAAPFLIAPDNAHEEGRVLTYGELMRLARALARHLHARGLERGDKLAFLLPNGYQTAAIFLGGMIGGFVVAPMNLRASRAALAYALDHCDCKLLFVAPEQRSLLEASLSQVSRRFAIETLDIDAADPFEGDAELSELAPVAAEDPALLMYTSGTTGTPKGVVLSHRNLLAGARAVGAWHGLTAADRVLSSLPLYHINGQVIATVAPFVSGGSIIAPHAFSVKRWWSDAERYRATWINLVPTIIAYLLNDAGSGGRREFPHIRFGRSASAPLPPEHHRAFEERFGIHVAEALGMTESASVAFCNPLARRRFGSIGLPCHVEARVVDRHGHVLPDGAPGEILFRGENVMSSYYKSPERTAEAIDPQGFLHTGDLGYRDADGFYFVTGRLKELIIKGGENIAPREIDEALLAHPAVLEAAAVGVPDKNYGQDILVAVVVKPGLHCEESALRAHCLELLGPYKTPRFITFVEELPKGPSGKVQRLALAQGWGEGSGRRPLGPRASSPAR
jgi:long-chain acyl-CoA synthetase